MRNKISYLFILILSITAIAVFGQQNPNQSSIFKPDQLIQKPTGFLNQLIDPNKFSMSQSYSLSFLSSGRQSTNIGMYLNTMNYQFSDPLMMQVSVGYMHQPLGGAGMQNNQNGNVFLQRAMLQYKPTENMTLTVDYQQLPYNAMSPYYWNRYTE
ncbi:hypothetical protein HQ585_03280 [candidate division KSB1 bacterium]|nr:hypothetical protein [candidate division KSB1 bacterium]